MNIDDRSPSRTGAVPASSDTAAGRAAAPRGRWADVGAGVALVSSIGIAVAGVIWRATGPSSDQVVLATNIEIVLLGVLGTTAAGLAAARRRGAMRRVWATFAAALAAYLAGDALWLLLVATSGSDPDVSIADIAYLAFYPLMALAPLTLLRSRSIRLPRASLLDAAIIVVAAALVEWVVVVRSDLGSALSVPGRFVALAYPIGDLLLLGGFAVLILNVAVRSIPSLTLLAAAIGVNLLGDLASGVSWFADSYETGGISDGLFVGFWVLATAAAAMSVRRPAPDGPAIAQGPYRGSVLPYIAVAIAGVITLVDALPVVNGIGTTVSVVAFLLVVGLAFVRVHTADTSSARLLVERAVLASDARAAALFRASGDSILLANADGLIVFESRALGTSRLGERAWHRASGVDAQRLELAVLSPETATSVAWQEAAGGPWIEATVTNARDDPAVGGVILSLRDITERRRLEAELDDARRLEALGRLAGGFAHHFNNIMTAQLGYAELLAGSLDVDDRRLADVDQIRASALRGARLTAQLLAVSQQVTVKACRVELDAVLAAAEPRIRRGLPVGVDLVLDARPVAAEADPDLLSRVLENVIANGVAAMPDGGRLTVTCAGATSDLGCPFTDGDDGPKHAVVRVADTGRGMDRRTLDRIFEPFFSTQSFADAPGLGMAEAYGLVRLMGGWIRADSTVGRGTTVELHLPTASTERTAADQARAISPLGDSSLS